MWDYGEEIPRDPEDLMLRGAPATKERSKCVILSVAAGLLHLKHPDTLPDIQATQALAGELRADLGALALEAEAALGPLRDRVTRREQEVLMHIHDLLWAAHDLDYRCYAVFPLPQLARVTLVVLRVLARGTVQAAVSTA